MEAGLISLVGFYYLFIVAIGLYMFSQRVKAVKNKELRGRYFKSYQGETPEYLKVIENHFNNQFQVPVIFMITVIFILILDQANAVFFYLNLAFVFTRLGHSFIHLTSNHVLRRAVFYFSGAILLTVQWALLIGAVL